jgi:NitT/TauT family transport system ATP-binding protein
MNPIPSVVLQASGLEVTFANENGGLTALRELTFSLSRQEFVCVLGPSGSGKSTLLRVLAGILKPSAGDVRFTSGSDNQLPRISLVFQQANLMPWRTAVENITLPLELRGMRVSAARVIAREWLERTGLGGFENAWPGDLSGGMAQRVALARAFIQDPDLLLLDEPFGSLDALTREQMGSELLRLWQAQKKTVLMVTHSISEALLLSDRILVLTSRPGRVCSELNVTLQRPRHEEMRYSPEFGLLARELRSAIR